MCFGNKTHRLWFQFEHSHVRAQLRKMPEFVWGETEDKQRRRKWSSDSVYSVFTDPEI